VIYPTQGLELVGRTERSVLCADEVSKKSCSLLGGWWPFRTIIFLKPCG